MGSLRGAFFVKCFLLIFSSLLTIDLSEAASHTNAKKPTSPEHKLNKTWEESPQALFSTFEEHVPLTELAKHGDPCNQTAFNSTFYYRAWKTAHVHDLYSDAAESFNHFEKVTRKGRKPEWRRDRCDSWPISLMWCNNQNKCDCFTPKNFKMTQFSPEMRKFDDGVQRKVCRVKFGHKCSYEVPALRCANKFTCVSGICGGTWFFPSLNLVGFTLALAILQHLGVS